MYRLRQITDRLGVAQQKALLKLAPRSFIDLDVNGAVQFDLPKWINKQKQQSLFGLWLEATTRCVFDKYVLTTSHDGNIIPWVSSSKTGKHVLDLLCRHKRIDLPYTKECTDIINKMKRLTKRLVRKTRAKLVECEVAFKLSDDLAGHPDYVLTRDDSSVIPIEMKTTQYWKGMANLSLIQLLAYVVMAKVDGKIVKHACLFLPLQNTFYMLSVENWEFEGFLLKLMEFTNATKHEDQMMYMAQYHPRIPMTGVGSHFEKSKTIYASLLKYYKSRYNYSRPGQIFLASPKDARKITLTKKDISDSHQFITKNNLRVYIHAPYIINFCQPFNEKSIELGEETSYSLDRLITELDYCVKLGMLGVVVHTGKSCKMDVVEAYDKMIESITYVLDNSDDKSVLLFETPAGQGTEMTTKPTELIELYQIFAKSHPNRMKICVDTCHVFAAGYDPYEYMVELIGSDVPICLVHYNGSKTEKGSCKDRHQCVNRPDQKIPIESMRAVLDLCKERGIDMVTE